MGTTPEAVADEIRKYDEYDKLGEMSDDQKLASDKEKWTTWLNKYRQRIQKILENG